MGDDNNMRMVNLYEDDNVKEFAQKAAKHLAEHDEHTTFTDSDIEAGCLFAMRYGFFNDCVVVFRLDDVFEPVNYQQLNETYVEDTEEVR